MNGFACQLFKLHAATKNTENRAVIKTNMCSSLHLGTASNSNNDIPDMTEFWGGKGVCFTKFYFLIRQKQHCLYMQSYFETIPRHLVADIKEKFIIQNTIRQTFLWLLSKKSPALIIIVFAILVPKPPLRTFHKYLEKFTLMCSDKCPLEIAADYFRNLRRIILVLIQGTALSDTYWMVALKVRVQK